MTCGEPSNNDDDWIEYRKFVLMELERLNTNQSALHGEVQAIKTAIAVIETKIVIYSAIAGTLVSVAVAVILHFL